MRRDETQLFRWRPEGQRWIDLGEGSYRPAQIRAEFLVGDVHVEVEAQGDDEGVRIVHMSHRRFAGTEERAAALAKIDPKDHRARLGTWTAALRPEDIAAFDATAAAAELDRATIVRYLFDDAGRPLAIAGGADAPYIAIQDMRRWLAGPEGPPPPGPKAKATLDQAAKLWRSAARKKIPAARAVAEGLDVSISTAHRYIAAARKAGLIDQEA